jgi:hypothetical protein
MYFASNCGRCHDAYASNREERRRLIKSESISERPKVPMTRYREECRLFGTRNDFHPQSQDGSCTHGKQHHVIEPSPTSDELSTTPGLACVQVTNGIFHDLGELRQASTQRPCSAVVGSGAISAPHIAYVPRLTHGPKTSNFRRHYWLRLHFLFFTSVQ